MNEIQTAVVELLKELTALARLARIQLQKEYDIEDEKPRAEGRGSTRRTRRKV